MRIRRKPWAKQELEEAKFYIDDPTIYRGKWKEQFEDKECWDYPKEILKQNMLIKI